MRFPWFPLLCCCTVVSCQKVKDAVAAAKAKVTNTAATKTEEPVKQAGEIDKTLEAGIDRTAEGVRFRKELPFPAKLTIREIEKVKSNGLRLVRTSALGKESSVVEGTQESVKVWTRSADHLVLTLEKDTFNGSAPAPSGPAAPAEDSSVKSELTGMSASFKQTDGKWKSDGGMGGDFKRAVWIQNIEPGIADMAIDAGALPCPYWFGKRRFKEGDAISLTGDGLKLLFQDAAAKGRLDLVFEGVEGVEGQPCGRFSIRGECSKRPTVKANGGKSSGELSISSGKVWLSLLHPVVLRQELEAVVSSSGEEGGVAVRSQGAMTISSLREWKPGN